MAMEITNNYSNYVANYTDTAKKSSSNAATEVKTNTSTNSKDKVQEYYEKLCKKFPEITFNTSGTIMSGSENKLVINLSYECLKKMANDPEFAKEVEWNLSGEAAGHKWMYAQAKADNAVIHGDTRVYDANGNITGSCNGMTRTSGSKQNSTTLNAEKKQKERLEKKREERKILEEKAAKKRAEKKAEEKRIAERQAEKKAAAEERFETGEYTINVTGAGIKAVSSTTAVPMASFEAKA